MKRFLLLASLAAAGCTSTPESGPKDSDWTNAEAAYLGGEWGSAISGYERWIAANSSDRRVNAAKLRIARSWLSLGKPGNALPVLDEVLNSGPASALVADAHAARGMAYHGLGSPPKAEAEFVDALRIGGDEVRRDECLYYLGLSKIRQGRWEPGLTDLFILLRESPDSPYAPKAKALRAAPDHIFSIQAGAFADPAGARRRAEELKAKGYEPFLVPDGALNCVRIGRFTTWREAQDEAKILEAAGIETTVVP